MGMVFQQFNLFPHLTVRENIKLAPVKLKVMTDEEADKRALELLARVGLPDKADSYPAPAFRRSAAAYRHRACAGNESGCDAVRRADLGA